MFMDSLAIPPRTPGQEFLKHSGKTAERAVEMQSEGMSLSLEIQEGLPGGSHIYSFNKHLLCSYEMLSIDDEPLNKKGKISSLLQLRV